MEVSSYFKIVSGVDMACKQFIYKEILPWIFFIQHFQRYYSGSAKIKELNLVTLCPLQIGSMQRNFWGFFGFF